MTPPSWLKTVAWAALVWNLLGVIAFATQALMTPDMISQLPQEQQAAYENTPLWASITFAVAVLAGTLGCVLLLFKKALARELFIISLAAVILQQYYNFIVIDSLAMFGASAVFMPVLVILVAISLLVISQQGKTQRWLN